MLSFKKINQFIFTLLLILNMLCIPSTVFAFATNSNLVIESREQLDIFKLNNIDMQYCSYGYDVMEATAYSPDEGWNITASGIPLHEVIYYGVASNDYPLHSRLYIECPSAPWINGEYVVVDRMAYSGCIDIAMGSIEECINFGRRTIYVSVID